MNFRRLIIRNLLRNKRRSGLTVFSIGFSLFLLLALFTFLDMLMNPPASDDSALRLAVRRSTSLAEQMPLAYGDKLKKVSHVRRTLILQWFGGVYKEPKNFFANFGVGDGFWEMFPEVFVSDETKRAFAAERIAAVAGQDLVDRFGWKVGDRITLLGTIFPVDLEMLIVGAFTSKEQQSSLYFHFDYLNEALDRPNTVSSFWLQADRAESIPGIIETVDGMFHNTAAETKTETEKSFILGFAAMLGNVRMMVGSIAMVVVFTMLLVSASTMAMTIRERVREIAILRAIGYTQRMVVALILGESIAMGMLGALVGCGLAAGMASLPLYSLTQGFIDRFSPRPSVILDVWATALAVGAVSGLFPAISAARMTITRAMRAVE